MVYMIIYTWYKPGIKQLFFTGPGAVPCLGAAALGAALGGAGAAGDAPRFERMPGYQGIH